MRRFHVDNTLPDPIWVYGSNLAGRHGRGAARVAASRFGAARGVGVGRRGSSYGIPTKNEQLATLSLDVIKGHVDDFISYAKRHPTLEFFVTGIGCGLAGYTPAQIAPMFKDAPLTCSFPDTWAPYLTEESQQETEQ